MAAARCRRRAMRAMSLRALRARLASLYATANPLPSPAVEVLLEQVILFEQR